MPLPENLLLSLPASSHSFLTHFFSSCPPYIGAAARKACLRKGQKLMSADSPCANVFLLLSGRLQAIEEMAPNLPYSFTEIAPIQVVGDLELFTNSPVRYVTLSALEASVCLSLPAATYLAWMKADANALFLRTQMLMCQIAAQTRYDRQYFFMGNRKRFLLFLHQECMKKTGLDLPVTIRQTREEMASKVGCSIRTLNRIILSLNREGLIASQHGKVHISPAQLAEIAAQLDPAPFGASPPKGPTRNTPRLT